MYKRVNWRKKRKNRGYIFRLYLMLLKNRVTVRLSEKLEIPTTVIEWDSLGKTQQGEQ